MSCPSGVRNSNVRVEFHSEVDTRFVNKLLQFFHLANLLECVYLILFVTINGKSSRVVSTVFQPCKSCGIDVSGHCS